MACICGREVMSIKNKNVITTTEGQQEKRWRREQEDVDGVVVARVCDIDGVEMSCAANWIRARGRDFLKASMGFRFSPKIFNLQKGRREKVSFRIAGREPTRAGKGRMKTLTSSNWTGRYLPISRQRPAVFEGF
jgi:hypothetical protein